MKISNNNIIIDKITNIKCVIASIEKSQKEICHIIISIISVGIFAIIRAVQLAILKGDLKKLEFRVTPQLAKRDENATLSKNDPKEIKTGTTAAVTHPPVVKNIPTGAITKLVAEPKPPAEPKPVAEPKPGIMKKPETKKYLSLNKLTGREFVESFMQKLNNHELGFSFELIHKLARTGVNNLEGCRLLISEYLIDPNYGNLLITQLENFIYDKISSEENMYKYVKTIDRLIFTVIHKQSDQVKKRLYKLLLQSTLTLPEELTRAHKGLNQYHFANGEGIMACGSFAVEALIRRERNYPMDVEGGILPSGLCRHRKLNKPPNTYSYIDTDIYGPTNPEVSSGGETIREAFEIGQEIPPLHLRYEFILAQIPDGASGILLVQREFMMLRKLKDGKVELFDSHGTKSPYAEKSEHGAYFATFKNVIDAAQWLCAHQIPNPDVDHDVIIFFPAKVKPETELVKELN